MTSDVAKAEYTRSSVVADIAFNHGQGPVHQESFSRKHETDLIHEDGMSYNPRTYGCRDSQRFHIKTQQVGCLQSDPIVIAVVIGTESSTSPVYVHRGFLQKHRSVETKGAQALNYCSETCHIFVSCKQVPRTGGRNVLQHLHCT